ncbi:hypothetical protein BDZ45DRAFT_388817 [Acephala macrosclerotiorum]|nr:hypothetical protein BDZ45DRAFT_388817 [Acephala macrosclerotiorum]
MTEQEIYNAKLENSRRRQARKIWAEIDILVKDAKNKDTEGDTNMAEAPPKSPASSKPDSSNSGDVSDEDVDYVPPPCPRVDEIYDHLCAKRRELALDSLHFPIPEHLLHAYITREGGLDLTIDEWRGFLIRCHADGELFRYRPIGAPPTTTEGVVTRISLGWPSTTLPPNNMQPPTALEIEMLDAATTKIMKIGGVLHDKEHFDYDKDLFRRLANHELKEMTFHDGNGQPLTGGLLSKEQFDRCIAQYERRGEKFW